MQNETYQIQVMKTVVDASATTEQYPSPLSPPQCIPYRREKITEEIGMKDIRIKKPT